MSQVYENRMESVLPRTMQLVREPLSRVERLLAEQLQSDVPVIDEMVRCGGATGGKRFRPVLLLLSAQANGGVAGNHEKLATAIEMIHAATLVHDDIIDNADKRRHVPTINNRWGNQGAVLFGDYLFTQAFYLASLTGSALACQIIGEATNTVCEGELQQGDAAGNFETTLAEYFQIISRKTAALCACATRLGVCLQGDHELSNQWHGVGHNLGMAFQIIDDVLDFHGDPETCGKTLGTDLQTAKPTLPLLLALDGESDSSRNEWVADLSSGSADMKRVREWLDETGAVDAALAIAKRHVQTAIDFTDKQPTAVAAAFQELAGFLLRRTW